MNYRLKMFAEGDMLDKLKMYTANWKSKKGGKLSYILKSEKIQRLVKNIRLCAYEKITKLNAEGYYSLEPLPFSDRTSGEYKVLEEGTIWAKNNFDCMWVHLTCDVSKYDISENDINFLVDLGGEGLVVDKQGNGLQAITCYASDYDYKLGRPEKKVILNHGFVSDGKVDFWIDAAANDLFGYFHDSAEIKRLDVVKVNHEVRALAYDLEVLLSAFNYAGNEQAKEFFKVIKQVESKCVFPMNNQVASECRELLKPLFEYVNKGKIFDYGAIGHAHLDLAWLWPIRETQRKGLRTFSTQLMNLDKYPDYMFGASQAQLFQWIKERDSSLYDRVKKYAQQGRFEVQGATWVEMDSNLISLESMIRQFYYGKKYFMKEFGLDMKMLWLPDSFGYSPCLPQVMRLSNVPYFLTQKLSWNTVTKFPYHTFNWVGIDGSKVFAHMLPDNTYNSPCRADKLTFGVQNYQEKNITNKAFMLFGIGDGGAGPGFEHIERATRLKDLAPLPKVKMQRAVDFFDDFVTERDKFSDYQGELYLEKHQGTYTTQARNKWYNRKCEFALRNYELLVCMLGGKCNPISKEELEEIWKEVLLYQFHDILPGSSIDRVYDESVPRYKAIYSKLNDAISQLLSKIAIGKCFFNFNSYDSTHIFKNGDNWYKVNVPKLCAVSANNAVKMNDFQIKTGANFIENDCIKVTFTNGEITSYFDKKLGREFVAKGASLLKYSVYKDMGDCWDMRRNYAKGKRALGLLSFDITSDGAMAKARAKYSYKNMLVSQEVVLLNGEDMLRINLHIDNKQRDIMLRAEFDTNISTQKCAFNTQCGHIYRTTTENNPTEKAQYEVSGQKFVDLSDGIAGLALINDCKYGFRCKGSTIDINLLRSPHNGPGKNVDQGEFDICLALYSHSDGVNSEVYKRAYIINNPIAEFEGKQESAISSYALDSQNVVIESVKAADMGGEIVRIYNSSEIEQSFVLNNKNYGKAEVVNVPEDKIGEFEGSGTIKPFELLNIRFFD